MQWVEQSDCQTRWVKQVTRKPYFGIIQGSQLTLRPIFWSLQSKANNSMLPDLKGQRKIWKFSNRILRPCDLYLQVKNLSAPQLEDNPQHLINLFLGELCEHFFFFFLALNETFSTKGPLIPIIFLLAKEANMCKSNHMMQTWFFFFSYILHWSVIKWTEAQKSIEHWLACHTWGILLASLEAVIPSFSIIPVHKVQWIKDLHSLLPHQIKKIMSPLPW
jgi:hypothetical protein